MFRVIEKRFLQLFNFEHNKLKQTHFEKLAQLLIHYEYCYATSKFDVGKINVELTLPLKAKAVFKKQRANRLPLQLQKTSTTFTWPLYKISHNCPVNTDSLSTGNAFNNPVFKLKKGESLIFALQPNDRRN